MTKTEETIVAAALRTLREDGFAGATSRAIARRGDFNQALIFYHFGSLENLLLAALKQTSEERLARYREAVLSVESLGGLVPVMADLWEEDKAAGHVQIVAQVIAGSANRPEFRAEIVELMAPWNELAEESVSPPCRPALTRRRHRLRDRRLVPRGEPRHLPRSRRRTPRCALRPRPAVDATDRTAPHRPEVAVTFPSRNRVQDVSGRDSGFSGIFRRCHGPVT